MDTAPHSSQRLETLAEDPEKFFEVLEELSQRPRLRYLSLEAVSGETTQLCSPDTSNQDGNVAFGLAEREACASSPYQQFTWQVLEEEKQLVEAFHGRQQPPCGETFARVAYQNVRSFWKDQGIWDDWWDTYPSTTWMHEKALPLQQNEAADHDPPSARFGMPEETFAQKTPHSHNHSPKDFTLQLEQEYLYANSRPYHQFLSQIKRERVRLGKAENSSYNDISVTLEARAYMNVKGCWARHSIWNERWGLLPGTSWARERSPEMTDETRAVIFSRHAYEEASSSQPVSARENGLHTEMAKPRNPRLTPRSDLRVSHQSKESSTLRSALRKNRKSARLVSVVASQSTAIRKSQRLAQKKKTQHS